MRNLGRRSARHRCATGLRRSYRIPAPSIGTAGPSDASWKLKILLGASGPKNRASAAVQHKDFAAAARPGWPRCGVGILL